MKALDAEFLAERSRVLEAHLGRIQEALPSEPAAFRLGDDAADAVTIRLLFAIQVVLDVSVFACIHFGLQAPASYNDSVARLAYADRISGDLGDRLEKAATLRDVLVHAFDQIDRASIHHAARTLPDDLRLFMAELTRNL